MTPRTITGEGRACDPAPASPPSGSLYDLGLRVGISSSALCAACPSPLLAFGRARSSDSLGLPDRVSMSPRHALVDFIDTTLLLNLIFPSSNANSDQDTKRPFLPGLIFGCCDFMGQFRQDMLWSC